MHNRTIVAFDSILVKSSEDSCMLLTVNCEGVAFHNRGSGALCFGMESCFHLRTTAHSGPSSSAQMPFPECSHSFCVSVISGVEWDKYYTSDVRAAAHTS